jgi:predicted PurR-regulated permease PerM
MSDTTRNVRISGIDWKPLIRVLVGVAVLLLVLVVLRSLTSLLETILISVFLAIAADAVARRVQRLGVSRGWSITIVLVGGIMTMMFVAFMLVSPLVSGGTELVQDAPEIAAEIEASDAWQFLSERFNLSDEVINQVKDVLVSIPGVLLNFFVNAVNGIFGLVTILIAVAFLMTGGDKALGLAIRLVPRLSTANGWSVVVGAYDNIGKYVVGATVQAVSAGTSLALVLFVLDVPYAVPLGVFMLIMDYIPLVGATIGTIPAVAVALFAGSVFDAVVVLVFLVVYQQVENSLIQPRIQGKVVQLPGIAIFFSVLVGGQLLGVLGALVAVPIASIVQIIIRQYLEYTGRHSMPLPRMFDDRGEPAFVAPAPIDVESPG